MFTKESLEKLKNRIDLIEVLSPHIQLKRFGKTHKALCPFHQEKTPSFVVGAGDSHYHCFGCGAHGDAIAFLMNFLKLSFVEAIERLAEKFGVHLEKVEKNEDDGLNKSLMRNALEQACLFYHFYLLYTEEGHAALEYLYGRGIDLDFILRFKVGLAPRKHGILLSLLRKKGFDENLLQTIGLLKENREFFLDRITFPILDALGHTIGFSARKYREENPGPKYINSPETPLFKKSHTLYGLNFCRKRIVKERKAVIVEGQIDALRLIQEGLTITVAGQGTAFGQDHVKELKNLGINQVYLALDGDEAGIGAAIKIGDLFQKEGIEVYVASLGDGGDPDLILRQKGISGMIDHLKQSHDYLSFLYKTSLKKINSASPAAKNEMVQGIADRIRRWDEPLMVHESLRKLAHLANVPENLLSEGEETSYFIKKKGKAGIIDVDPDKILEAELLRWLLVAAPQIPFLLSIAKKNLHVEDWKIDAARHIYTLFIEHSKEYEPMDIIALSEHLSEESHRLFLSEILQKKINPIKAKEGFTEALHKILLRNWMEKREEIKMQIHRGNAKENELIMLAKQFDALKGNPPQVMIPEEI